MTGEQLAFDVHPGDVHACDFIARGERLRCLHCGTDKPLPSWSIDHAPEHDWIEVSATERAADQLLFYKCQRCGLGATQTRPADVQPNPAPTCRAKASTGHADAPEPAQHEVRPHFTPERGT